MIALNLIVLLILLSWTLALAFLLMTGLALQLRARRLRRELTLRPNCLLTRAPLVFITGRRSFFYFMQYWNFIPRFMYEHGYLVEVWRLPWRNQNLQRGVLMKRLRKRVLAGERAVHLFYDATMTTVVRDVINLLAKSDSTGLASLTETDSLLAVPPAIDTPFGITRWIQFGFDLHKRFSSKTAQATSLGLGSTMPAWQIETRFLDRAVELAEDEVINS